MAQLTYGDNAAYTVDVPEAILVKLAQRTYNHIMSNEALSATKVSKQENGYSDEDAKTLHEWRVTKAKQVQDGTIGLRAGGPRRDPLEVECEAEAIRRLKAAAKAQGGKLPTKMDDEYVFDNGVKMTLREMVSRKVAKEGDDIKRVAQRVIAERDRNARKQAETTKENTAEAFGL